MKRLLIILVLSGFLMSCGSGGGGGEGTPANVSMTQMAGVVVAPSGVLAKGGPPGLFRWFASLVGFPDEAVAQVQGLSPVQNARVFLLTVDNTGRPIGAPLSVSTTDSNGIFFLNVPSGTNLSPTASTLTIVQVASGGASTPVPIGTPNVLNVPAVQQLMLVDPAAELGTRRIIAAGPSRFSASAAAGYVGLVQSLLDHVPNLVGSSIPTTITNIQNHFSFQNEVLPILVDIEQSTQFDQSLLDGTFNLFAYTAYPDSASVPFHRTIEHGDVTFAPATGTIVVNDNEFGATLTETCTSICTRTFTLQSFVNQTFAVEGLFFLTASNRIIFSAPGRYSFAGQLNPTGTLGIVGQQSSFDGHQGLNILVKKGTNISAADFGATFNYVSFGSSLNQSTVNQPTVLVSPWPGILQSRTGTGTVRFDGASNSPTGFLNLTGGDSTMSQQVSCTPQGGGCEINSVLSSSNGGFPSVALPFTILPDGSLTLTGMPGFGTMSSDRALYAATQVDLLHPADISFSVVVRQPSAMTNADLTGTYRVITLEDDLTTTAQVTTRLISGTVLFDGMTTGMYTTTASQVDRTEGCPAGACSVNTTITGGSSPVSETRSYAVTPTGILTFTGGNIPSGATVSGGVSPDASFFVVQMQANNAAGVSTRSISLGVKTQ
jgi:hypothetical protein